ncbi:MAG: acyl carrier protein [Solitalea-like symbiont of Acarus siro]
MNKEEIQEKVIDVVCEKLSKDRNAVTPESSFIKDLGADSLDMVELVMELENKFGIQIPDEDAEKISTVKESVEYLSNVLSKKDK